MRPPVLLLSGGLDSAVCLRLLADTPQVVCLFVHYGQRQAWQEYACASVLAAIEKRDLKTASIRMPSWRPDPRDPTMLVPGRNRVLIALAATLGEPVTIGCNSDDRAVYEDCRPQFLAGLDVDVRAPLLSATKVEIAAVAKEVGLDVEQTWSCYYPRGEEPCGACDACIARAKVLG